MSVRCFSGSGARNDNSIRCNAVAAQQNFVRGEGFNELMTTTKALGLRVFTLRERAGECALQIGGNGFHSAAVNATLNQRGDGLLQA
jgi:hypothetical protein